MRLTKTPSLEAMCFSHISLQYEETLGSVDHITDTKGQNGDTLSASAV